MQPLFYKTAIIRDILLFRQNLKNRVRQVHWIFPNPPRKTQSHQILAVLRELNLSTQTGAFCWFFIPYEVLYVIARHCQRRCRGNLPEGLHITKPTQDTFVLAWGKGAQSKRVSIIAPDNAISKVQFAPWASYGKIPHNAKG